VISEAARAACLLQARSRSETARSPICARETLLCTQIYTGKQLPLAPLAFKIAADDRLRCEVEIGQLRPTLHYKCAILLKMLPKFALVRSFLLQNNVQEYLFKFE
jgi:hypothetical protein